MLSLPEELLLLALHDEKGTVLFNASTALPYGLSGTILLELLFQNRIVLKGKNLVCADTTPLGDSILDETLSLIASSRKIRNVKYWIPAVLNKVTHIRERITESLVQKGILKREGRRILGLFPYNRYPMQNPACEYEIRSRIRNVVLFDHPAKEREVALISLIKVCGLVNELFTKDERKQATARIKELSKDEVIGKMVSEVVAQMTAAISAAVTASTAAAAAAAAAAAHS
jgi:Golgi phosphoprotein 3